MAISQKCQYALRALLELAKRHNSGPARIGDIAEAQQIPQRFLEVILNVLKQGGFADSRRGKDGGYILSRAPTAISVGAVICFVEGPLHPVEELATLAPGAEPPRDLPWAALLPMWQRVEAAIRGVVDETTLADLVEADRKIRDTRAPDFSI